MSIKGTGRTWVIAASAAVVALTMAAAGAYAARDSGEGLEAPGEDPGYVTVLEPAPIESATLRIAESFPPQYFLLVVSGLQNSCVRFEGYEVERKGTDIAVTVTNRVPASGAEITCAQVSSTVETNMALGSEFTSGETYRVVVNGKPWEEFVAQ